MKEDYQPVSCRKSLGSTLSESHIALKAQWSIVKKDDRTVRLVCTSGFTEPIQEADYSGKVAVISRILEMLSQDIARTDKTPSGTKTSK
ncbi:MAG: hypothetical protein E3K36_14255 [Candidatus Brocadia sp.]|nr:hypothetical protein [Candidatus Brocadia sp.]